MAKHRLPDEPEYVGRHRKKNLWPIRIAVFTAGLSVFGASSVYIYQHNKPTEFTFDAPMAAMVEPVVVVPREAARLRIPVEQTMTTQPIPPPAPSTTARRIATTTPKPPPPPVRTTTRSRPAPATTAAIARQAPPAVPQAPAASRVAEVAKRYVNAGLRYCWGGKVLSSCVDCSGFVWNVLKQAGYNVPYRNSAALASWAVPVSKSNARPGDLVLYYGHVGIYMGNNMMIDHGGTPGAKFRAIYGSPRFGRIP